jgi:hypothetical protein
MSLAALPGSVGLRRRFYNFALEQNGAGYRKRKKEVIRRIWLYFDS